MAVDIRAWEYTDDLGNVYTRGVAKYISDQMGVGLVLIGGQAVTSLAQEPLPGGVKPRVVKCIDPASGRRREVVIMNTSDSSLWSGAATAIALHDGAGASTVYTVYSRRGERRRVRAPGL
jgi:hypothetical protein